MNAPAPSSKPSRFMKCSLSIMLPAIGILFATVPEAVASNKGIALRLLACEVTTEPMKVVLATKDSSSAEIEVPSASFSLPAVVSGRRVEIKVPKTDETLCAVSLPEEGESFAIMLGSNTPHGFLPVVVRLDDKAFQPGDFQFINCSGKTVVVKLGGTEVVIEAEGSARARPTECTDNRYFIVTMHTRGKSGDKVFASTRWPLDKSKRGYIMLLAKPSGRVTYRAVEEIVAKP